MDRELAIERLTKMGWVCDMDGCNVNCDVCAEALDLAIEALKAEPRQHHLGKHADITVIDEVATHEIRTETHGDLISRADIEYHTQLEARGNGQYEEVEVAYKSDIDNLPSAATDISDYSDRLWKAAYERGKAEGAEELKYMRQRNAQLETMLHAQQMLAYGARMCKPPTERTVGWIPVSERLPKEKQEVYVTVYFTEGDTGRAYGYIDGFGNWHLYSTVEGTLNGGYEVTAWMPLPEPYKGGDTE